MWVAKIGGSLGDSPSLTRWLAAFCADGARRWLLVPGGGAWADLVRGSQRRWGYADAHAHGMALQAMGLYASELSAIEPRLHCCDSVAACLDTRTAWPRLWRPSLDDVAELTEVPADWRATSDSLALALAHRLAAEGVLLLKSAPPVGEQVHVATLAAAGYVDEWMPVLMRNPAVPVYWSARDHAARLPPDETRRIIGD